MYDWVIVVEDDIISSWLLMKWALLDFIFIFGLPEFRIPWLEFSQPFCTAVYLVHVIFDGLIMLNIGLPFGPAMVAFLKVFWDREVAISEQYVKVSSVTQNASLILGKQIINILPEGSAVLNPGGAAFCLGGDRPTVSLPLHFNATTPVEIQIIRTDLETNSEETLKLSRDQIKSIKKLVKRQENDPEMAEAKFDWPVKKPGVYRLGKVLDEYKLEVQRPTQNTFVVPCPKARVVASSSSDRCVGDLSDLALEVEGTPPLKINYSRSINGKDHSFHFQSLQPEGFSSPLMGSLRSSALVLPDDESFVSWAKAQKVTVSLNESMHPGGAWQYAVDEVHDAFGNVVKYQSPADDPEMRPKPKHLVQDFNVKERPVARLGGCDLRHPLKVAKGKSTKLPITFGISGQKDTAHSLTWHFSPIDSLTKNGEHGEVVTLGTHNAKNAKDWPKISEPGLYTLKSVASGACAGEVQEPESCLLLNPLEPNLVLRSTDIPDKCAGNSIGVAVDFDFVGTPPFTVNYQAIHNGSPEKKSFTTNSMRHQEELIPSVAGTHTYIFKSISDSIYSAQPLSGPEMTLETTVKPVASAFLRKQADVVTACLDEEIEVDVLFAAGEAPFTLEWELVHDGKRKQFKADSIADYAYTIRTSKLTTGGEYSLSLIAIKDTSGCRVFLQDELKISVRRQRPRAAFGLLDGQFKSMTIEEAPVNLPVRLSGEGPWTVALRNLDEGENAKISQKTLRSGNDILKVAQRGVYEMVDVSDNQCHGTVDPKASQFEVGWFPRPELKLLQSPSIHEGRVGYIKNEVCEGDMDGFEIGLIGKLFQAISVHLACPTDFVQVLPPIMSNMTFDTRPAVRLLLLSIGNNSMLHSAKRPFRWILQERGHTFTSFQLYPTACTTITRNSAMSLSSKRSIPSLLRNSYGPVRRIRVAWQTKTSRTRWRLSLLEQRHGPWYLRSSMTAVPTQRLFVSRDSTKRSHLSRFPDNTCGLAASLFVFVRSATPRAADAPMRPADHQCRFSSTTRPPSTPWTHAKNIASASVYLTPLSGLRLLRSRTPLMAPSVARSLPRRTSSVLPKHPASSLSRPSRTRPRSARPPLTSARRSTLSRRFAFLRARPCNRIFMRAARSRSCLISPALRRLSLRIRAALTPRRDIGVKCWRQGMILATTIAR